MSSRRIVSIWCAAAGDLGWKLRGVLLQYVAWSSGFRQPADEEWRCVEMWQAKMVDSIDNAAAIETHKRYAVLGRKLVWDGGNGDDDVAPKLPVPSSTIRDEFQGYASDRQRQVIKPPARPVIPDNAVIMAQGPV